MEQPSEYVSMSGRVFLGSSFGESGLVGVVDSGRFPRDSFLQGG